GSSARSTGWSGIAGALPVLEPVSLHAKRLAVAADLKVNEMADLARAAKPCLMVCRTLPGRFRDRVVGGRCKRGSKLLAHDASAIWLLLVEPAQRVARRFDHSITHLPSSLASARMTCPSSGCGGSTSTSIQ